MDVITQSAVAAALFGWSLAVRAVGAPSLLRETEGAGFFGADAYYHARRIWYSVVNFPEFLHFDPYLNFPQGARAIWSPTFDWLAALWVRLAVGAGDQAAMERTVVWIPPLLGAATVVALYLVAARHFSRSLAVSAALLLSILPGHFWYSQLGFVDHHAAVGLVTVWLLGAGWTLVGEGSGPARGWPAAGGGVAMAAAVLLWPGCLIHVAVFQAALVARLLSSEDQASSVRRARGFAVASALAALLVLPWTWSNEWELWGSVSPLVLSRFQPIWFASAALCFAAVERLWAWRGLPPRLLRRLLDAGVCAGLVLGLALTLFPELSSGGAQSWAWLAKGEHFQASVGESSALLAGGAERAEQLFTRALYLAPLLLVAAVARAWRLPPGPRARLLLIAWWCLALGTVTLLQRRFMDSSSVAWALLVGWALCELARELRRRSTVTRVAVGVAVLPLAAWALLPVARSYRPYLDGLRAAQHGASTMSPLGYQRVQTMREQMANWLRSETPGTSGWLDASRQPEYAVLAPWSDGHAIKYTAQRPVIWDGFGDDLAAANFAAAEDYYRATRESTALAILADLGVRYVVGSQGWARQVAPTSMNARLSHYRGAETTLTRPGSEVLRVDALAHHRLVFESSAFPGSGGSAPSYFKVYEIVGGARVRGRAPPGERVQARLALRSSAGGPFAYSTHAAADGAGRYELVLPYSTDRPSGAIEVTGPYEVEVRGKVARLSVPESAVREGRVLVGPSWGRAPLDAIRRDPSDRSGLRAPSP